jgi:hypothetical protein
MRNFSAMTKRPNSSVWMTWIELVLAEGENIAIQGLKGQPDEATPRSRLPDAA